MDNGQETLGKYYIHSRGFQKSMTQPLLSDSGKAKTCMKLYVFVPVYKGGRSDKMINSAQNEINNGELYFTVLSYK